MRSELISHILSEGVVVPPDIPNTRNFWHGGNLDDMSDYSHHKKGRYEYGPGLYLTTSYTVASKYAKGNRKLYIVTVADGNDISDVRIPENEAIEFTKKYVVKSERQFIISSLKSGIERRGALHGDAFMTMIINCDGIKGTNVERMKDFILSHGGDYHMVSSPFGYGENMMVLYNNDLIRNITRIKSGDTIETFDFH